VAKFDADTWGKLRGKMFAFARDTIKPFVEMKRWDDAYHLFLQGAQAAEYCEYGPVVSEFSKEAFTIIEEELSSSNSQSEATFLFVNTLPTLKFIR